MQGVIESMVAFQSAILVIIVILITTK